MLTLTQYRFEPKVTQG